MNRFHSPDSSSSSSAHFGGSEHLLAQSPQTSISARAVTRMRHKEWFASCCNFFTPVVGLLLFLLSYIRKLDFEDKTTHNAKIWKMVEICVGFGGASLLIAGYFLWENGPCHRSRRAEGWYLQFTLILLIVTSNMLSIDALAMQKDNQGNKAFPPLNSLIRLILAVHILEQARCMNMQPRFHDGPGTRCGTKESVHASPPTPSAKRATLELEATLGRVFAMKVGFFGIASSEKLLGWLIFCLVMLEQITNVFSDTAFTSAVFTIASFLNIVTMICLFGQIIQSAFVYPRVNKICDILHNLITNGPSEERLESLQYVLSTTSLGTLLEVGNWKTFVFLTDTALDGQLLTTLSKAILVDALQRNGVRASRSRQEAVCRIITSCYGNDLTSLKNLIDGSGTYHNLHKLVFYDINDNKIREDILDHLSREALRLRDRLGGRRGIKILSDVDDTLYCSGGMFPAGCDKRFPKHVVYPGFLSLLRSLDIAVDGDTPSCNLIFLSARPHLYKDLAEDHSYRLFESLVQDNSMHSFPTLLPGKWQHALKALLRSVCSKSRTWVSVGDYKVETYLKFRQLYPEYDFLFFGDNGQGDLWAAQRMMQESKGLGSQLLAVLIHEVMPVQNCLSRYDLPHAQDGWRERLQKQGLFFHKSYVGAALALHLNQPDLLSASQLSTVYDSAIEDFNNVRLMYFDWGSAWKDAEQDLKADLRAVQRSADQSSGGRVSLRRLRNMSEVLLPITPAPSAAALRELADCSDEEDSEPDESGVPIDHDEDTESKRPDGDCVDS